MDESLNIAKNLLSLMSERGLRTVDLAERTKIPATTINYILSQKTENPSIGTCLILAKELDVTLDQLCGIKKVLKEEKKQIPSKRINKFCSGSKIPLFSFDSLKDWRLNYDPNNHKGYISYDGLGNNIFSIEIGSFSKGIFPKNSVIIVKPQEYYREGDFVVASIKMNKPSIFQLIEEEGCLFLQPVSGNLLAYKYEIPNVILGRIIENRIVFYEANA